MTDLVVIGKFVESTFMMYMLVVYCVEDSRRSMSNSKCMTKIITKVNDLYRDFSRNEPSPSPLIMKYKMFAAPYDIFDRTSHMLVKVNSVLRFNNKFNAPECILAGIYEYCLNSIDKSTDSYNDCYTENPSYCCNCGGHSDSDTYTEFVNLVSDYMKVWFDIVNEIKTINTKIEHEVMNIITSTTDDPDSTLSYVNERIIVINKSANIIKTAKLVSIIERSKINDFLFCL